MRAALLEIDTVWMDEAANRKHVAAALPALSGADLALAPEMAFSGFSMDAQPDAEAVPFLVRLARQHSTALVAGYVGGEPEARENRAVAVTSGGDVAAEYVKVHPFSPAGEDRAMAAGNEIPVFGFAGMRAALAICYDLRFPELFRAAAWRGAELFLVIANWPVARVDHWRTLLQARAIENQAFVFGVNRIGQDPNVAYTSSSLAVGPRGEILHEGAGTFEFDPDEARRWRAEFPALRDSRPDLFGGG